VQKSRSFCFGYWNIPRFICPARKPWKSR